MAALRKRHSGLAGVPALFRTMRNDVFAGIDFPQTPQEGDSLPPNFCPLSRMRQLCRWRIKAGKGLGHLSRPTNAALQIFPVLLPALVLTVLKSYKKTVHS